MLYIYIFIYYFLFLYIYIYYIYMIFQNKKQEIVGHEPKLEPSDRRGDREIADNSEAV